MSSVSNHSGVSVVATTLPGIGAPDRLISVPVHVSPAIFFESDL